MESPLERKCPECGSTEFDQKPKGPHMGLYCHKCGRWITWVPQKKTHKPTTNFRQIEGEYEEKEPSPYDGDFDDSLPWE